MSLTDYIPTTGGNDSAEPTIESLEALFREREATLDLTAEFHTPYGNKQDRPTAVFPYTLYDQHGQEYGTGAKEFVVPDNGFRDNDAAVTEFLAGLTETPPEDLGVGAIHAVEGSTADADLSDAGDVIVKAPQPPEEVDE